MAHRASDDRNTGVDPESLYTRQNCIGKCILKELSQALLTQVCTQVVGALARYTKGKWV